METLSASFAIIAVGIVLRRVKIIAFHVIKIFLIIEKVIFLLIASAYVK